MAQVIKVSSDALDSAAKELSAAGDRLGEAASSLGGVRLSAGNGASLRPGGVSGTVREALKGYTDALRQHAAALGALSRHVGEARTLFEEAEKRLVAAVPRLETTTRQDGASGAFSAGVAGAAAGAADAASGLGQALGSYGREKAGSYHRDISLAMLEMSGIAYSYDPATGAFDREKLAKLGFVGSDYIYPPGAVVAWKTNEQGEPLLAIAFRGTTERVDWMVDLLAADSPDGIHTGFQLYTSLVRSKLDSVKLDGIDGTPFVAELIGRARAGEKVNLLFTGHSLGGAEAQVLAYGLLKDGVPNDSVSAYTFASPQPFTKSGFDAKLGDSAHVYNVINNIDVVPHAGAIEDDPFARWGNRNIGTDIRAVPSLGEATRELVSAAASIDPSAFPLKNAWELAKGAWEQVKDNHDLETYRRIVERL